MSKITSKLNKEILKVKTKVNKLMSHTFLNLSYDINVYSMKFIHKL